MIKIREIKIKVELDNIDYLLDKISKKLNIKRTEILNYEIIKKSIDARRKNEIFYVYEVNITVKCEDLLLKKYNFIEKALSNDYIIPETGSLKYENIVVVGSGPSGLFASYLLAQCGYNPLIIERGNDIVKREEDIKEFFNNNNLNINSNIQFGLGGAGTYSDGKLNTLVKDENNRMRYVFETFVKFGAPKEILYDYKPHIGTDILKNVVFNMKCEIERLGGKFLFNTCLTDLVINNNKLEGIIVNNKEKIKCDILVLGIGHSSRDTIRMLYKYLDMEPKGFAVGFRIVHNQSMIDDARLGKYKNILNPATYKLTYKAKNNRGVYSFCMCPGGYVVNASSEKNRICVNGMSYSKRDSKTANSGIVVTLFPRDFNNQLFGGLEFQEKIEENAYKLGNGFIPVQLLKDYYDNKTSLKFESVIPDVLGKYSFSNLNKILPDELNDALKEAFTYFGKILKGFDNPDSILLAVESRTSSAIKIKRDEDYLSNIDGIYPIGEGAGYSGGITTSAIDGIKAFEKIRIKYSKNK